MTHTPRRIEWDDLRYVLAVAENGGLAAAARALGVNHTTVLRRVNAFEEAQGVRLFERLPTGYALTAGGEEMLAAARRVSGAVAELERRLAGRDLRLEGTLRVATTDTLAASVLPRNLAAFRARHPGVVVELAVANRVADLTRRDADAAVRPMAAPPEALVGRRVCGIAFAVYAGPGGEAGPWLAPDEALAGSAAGRWARAHVRQAEVAARADSLLALRDLAAAGLGRAALPCYLGDADARLVRTGPVLPDAASELWLLTHEDLRRTARVRAFMEFMARAGQRARPARGAAPTPNRPDVLFALIAPHQVTDVGWATLSSRRLPVPLPLGAGILLTRQERGILLVGEHGIGVDGPDPMFAAPVGHRDGRRRAALAERAARWPPGTAMPAQAPSFPWDTLRGEQSVVRCLAPRATPVQARQGHGFGPAPWDWRRGAVARRRADLPPPTTGRRDGEKTPIKRSPGASVGGIDDLRRC